jgi:hypothetical protein
VLNNQVGIFAVGNSGVAVADGYFLMLAPPSSGVHVLRYGGGATAFGISLDETDTITVPPPLVLSAPSLNGGEFSFEATGPEGLSVVVEASSDLSNWQPVATNVLSSGSALLTFTAPNQDPRFFRARNGP